MLYVYLPNHADIILCVLEVVVLDKKSLTVSLSLESLAFGCGSKFINVSMEMMSRYNSEIQYLGFKFTESCQEAKVL